MAAIQYLNFRELSPLRGEATAEAVKLLRTEGGVIALVSVSTPNPVFGATTHFLRITAVTAETDWQSVTSINQIVPAPVSWDAVAGRDGLQITFEMAGGAINAVMLRQPNSADRSLSAGAPLESFFRPQFERTDDATPQFVTAVRDERSCVAYTLGATQPYLALADCADGLLLRNGGTFTLIYKTVMPGTVRGNSERPGRLYVVALDNKLKPAGSPVVLGDAPVYEFDATVRGGAVTVCATTPEGLWIGRGAGTAISGQKYGAPTSLISPSLVAKAEPGKFMVAAVDLTLKRVVAAEF